MVVMAFVYTLILQYIRINRSPRAKARWQQWLSRHRLAYATVRYLHTTSPIRGWSLNWKSWPATLLSSS